MRLATEYVTVLGQRLTPAQQYDVKVQGIQSASLIDYWKLNEISGPVVVDAVTTDRNGTYSGASVGSGTWNPSGVTDRCPTFDGTADGADIYTASLNTAMGNKQQGTLSIWFRITAADVWTDTTVRYFVSIQVDSNNWILLRKNSTNNQIQAFYIAGATAKSVSVTYSATTWTHFAMTWDKAANFMRCYLNGTQQGTDQTSLGTWSGALATTLSVIGARTTTYDFAMSGLLSRCALWSTALTTAQIGQIATTP